MDRTLALLSADKGYARPSQLDDQPQSHLFGFTSAARDKNGLTPDDLQFFRQIALRAVKDTDLVLPFLLVVEADKISARPAFGTRHWTIHHSSLAHHAHRLRLLECPEKNDLEECN